MNKGEDMVDSDRTHQHRAHTVEVTHPTNGCPTNSCYRGGGGGRARAGELEPEEEMGAATEAEVEVEMGTEVAEVEVEVEKYMYVRMEPNGRRRTQR